VRWKENNGGLCSEKPLGKTNQVSVGELKKPTFRSSPPKRGFLKGEITHRRLAVICGIFQQNEEISSYRRGIQNDQSSNCCLGGVNEGATIGPDLPVLEKKHEAGETRVWGKSNESNTSGKILGGAQGDLVSRED